MLTARWRRPRSIWTMACPVSPFASSKPPEDGSEHVSFSIPCSGPSLLERLTSLQQSHIMEAARAFDGKVESMMVDSQDGANQIQHRHWDKGASHEWGSHIPTICANVSLRQSRPVIPVRKLLSCSTWL